MHKDSFDFVYNTDGDYYDLVVDKKIQKVVEELKALPHGVLIRYLTYWSDGRRNRYQQCWQKDDQTQLMPLPWDCVNICHC